MNKRCYYEVLGIERDAPPQAIKGAYRKLAKEHHPDRNHGDTKAEVRFKEISEAYDVLKDDQKRAAYDRFGHAAFENGHGRGANGFDFASSFTDIFDDLFGEFTGGGRRARRQNRGQDLRYNLELSLEDAFRGQQAEIRVSAAVGCGESAGSGEQHGSRAGQRPTSAGIRKGRARQGFLSLDATRPSGPGPRRVL